MMFISGSSSVDENNFLCAVKNPIAMQIIRPICLISTDIVEIFIGYHSGFLDTRFFRFKFHVELAAE